MVRNSSSLRWACLSAKEAAGLAILVIALTTGSRNGGNGVRHCLEKSTVSTILYELNLDGVRAIAFDTV